jgi:hypothetical protein
MGIETRNYAAEGGKARAASLSVEERKEIAIVAAETRWGKKVLRAEYIDKPLKFGEFEIGCAVLEDKKTRVISIGSVLAAFGQNPNTGFRNGMPAIVSADNLKPFITTTDYVVMSAIPYRVGSARYTGLHADFLPVVCKILMKANAAGALTAHQKPAAKIAEVFYDALAIVGILALVDEATGFERARESDALAKILELYVEETFRPWVKTFPDEFWPLVAKIHGWPYNAGTSKRSHEYAKFISRFVYQELPTGVYDELKSRAPKDITGQRLKKLHQGLTPDTGLAQLDMQIRRVMDMMKISVNKDEFVYMYDKVKGRV